MPKHGCMPNDTRYFPNFHWVLPRFVIGKVIAYTQLISLIDIPVNTSQQLQVGDIGWEICERTSIVSVFVFQNL